MTLKRDASRQEQINLHFESNELHFNSFSMKWARTKYRCGFVVFSKVFPINIKSLNRKTWRSLIHFLCISFALEISYKLQLDIKRLCGKTKFKSSVLIFVWISSKSFMCSVLGLSSDCCMRSYISLSMRSFMSFPPSTPRKFFIKLSLVIFFWFFTFLVCKSVFKRIIAKAIKNTWNRGRNVSVNS